MKIIGISGSPRDRNTTYMLRTVLEATGADFELILLKDKFVNPCRACKGCYQTHKCIVDDDMQEIYDKVEKSDFILVGSPTYFSNVTGLMKNFIDRCLPFYLSRKLENKKAGLLSVGNFHNQLEFNEDGTCKWHKEETESVMGCINSLNSFCNHLGINVVGFVYALHSEPRRVEDQLKELAKKILSN